MKRRALAPLPLVAASLALAIVVTFALELAGDALGLCASYGLVPARATPGTALSSLFLHDPSGLTHIAGNVAALMVFGALVERALGHLRLLALYVLGGGGAAAFHVLANPESNVPEVGASGPIFALMAAAAMLNPRLAGFVVAYVALNIWQTVTGTGGDVATAAHIGGFVTGFVLMVLFFRQQLAEGRGWRPASRRPLRAVPCTPM